MRIEFWLRTPGNHHQVGKARTTDCVPRVGETVVLSDEDTHDVHSVHWYFDAKQPTVLVMLDP